MELEGIWGLDVVKNQAVGVNAKEETAVLFLMEHLWFSGTGEEGGGLRGRVDFIWPLCHKHHVWQL